MPELLDENQQIESTTIGVYRTSATVKGGRRFSFGALVVVGDRNGKVGFGYAKGKEVPQAVEKAQKYGQRQLYVIPRCGTTIHHEVEGTFGASRVRLIPAAPGTGVVAGTVVRAVLELAGVKDCLTKCYGSTNPENVLKAAMAAIEQLQTPAKIAELRGLKLDRTMIEDKIEKGKAYAPAAIDTEKKVRGPVNTLGSERRGRRGGNMSRRDRQATKESGDAPPAAGAAPAAPTK
ncbi:MAG: 30S ribosomal protein S5 [Phycisphaerales bacterium]|nr:30S ribosomal protein S5 [Phycisphaerales bacterium]